MKKFYDTDIIENYLKKTKYEAEIKELKENLFAVKYDKGEIVTSPLQNENLFQIVIEGSINIYFIRDDVSVYSLADGKKDYILGEMEIFRQMTSSVYAEANETLACLAVPIEQCRDKLLTNL